MCIRLETGLVKLARAERTENETDETDEKVAPAEGVNMKTVISAVTNELNPNWATVIWQLDGAGYWALKCGVAYWSKPD